MDYKEKYEQALERAVKLRDDLLKNSTLATAKGVESIFPELKESEDERMWLIKFIQEEIDCLRFDIRDYEDRTKLENLQRSLAWLEKQGEKDEEILILKDRVQPQPKQEWSEEDEKILSDIIKDLVHPWNEYIPDRIEDEIKWLKNRLKSLRPQSTWKPSDEQIEYLSKAILTLGNEGDCKTASILNELRTDLKKLKE